MRFGRIDQGVDIMIGIPLSFLEAAATITLI